MDEHEPTEQDELTHCAHEPTAPHRCPFQADVNNDEEFQCVCCENCERECLEDI